MIPSGSSALAPALAHLLETSGDVLFALDPSGRLTYANRATAAMSGLRLEDLIGKSLEEDFPESLSGRWRSASREAWASGQTTEYETFNPLLGRWVRVRIVPDAGGLAVQMRDVTPLRHAAALGRVSAALSGAGDPEDVVRVLLEHAVTAVGAYMGSIACLTPDGEHLELRGEVGFTPELRARFRRFSLSLGIPPCEAARTGQSVFIGGAAFDQQYPGSVGVRAADTRSLAAFPLTLEGRLWGVLSLSFREVQRFEGDERAFLHTLVEQCAQALGRTMVEARLHEQAERLATLNRTQRSLSAELDLNRLVQAVTDAGVELTGAQFGAFFYNLVNERQESYTLYTLSGVPREVFSRFPMPRNTAIFHPTFVGEGVVRSADITQDPRYGHTPPHHGMPEGHLPVRSYLAVPVVSRSGEVLGGLFFGHAEAGVFTGQAEELAQGLAAQTAVALDNSRLYGQLQESHALLERRVEERTRALEEQAEALGAFVRFTEAAGLSTDVRTLAREVFAVFSSFFTGSSAVYYEREGDRWHARAWTEDLAPEVVASITAGIPADAPAFGEAARTGQPVFVDGWDPEQQGVAETGEYGTAALYPLVVGGAVVGLLTVGLKNARVWWESARAVVRSAGRSLNLALERAEVAGQLAAQRDALGARTRALEAFAQLTRDLTLEGDPLALIRRAGEIVLPLLPAGYAVYWERDGERWRSRVQVGDLRHAELRAMVEAGFPYAETPTIRVPHETGEALYRDRYDRRHDNLGGEPSLVGTTASLPVKVGGEVLGVLVLGLFGEHRWTPTDRALLDTVTRSLGLALEGAQKAQALRERTLELERSNAELERFAYVASHDLQEPLRTIASFTELINRRYGEGLDDTGRKFLGLVTGGAERMKVLIDDLLVFSRLNSVREPLQAVALAGPLEEALERLRAATEESGARVTWNGLPVVLGARSELVQLFQNLVGNALKFRRPGVTPEVRVTAGCVAEGWQIGVQDNGIGIEAQYSERIFQIFQRLHLREEYAGTGMGLAIVRKIAEHHGGRVWVESVPGEGSTFFFILKDAG